MSDHNFTREEVYLAALLHDIGKFWQRADEYWDKTKNFSEETKGNIDYISRKNQNDQPTHQHVIWTFEFLNRYSSKNKLLDKIVTLAARHHRPDDEDEAIIQLADWWASGIEREYDESKDSIKLGKERYKKQPIGNIFSKVIVQGNITEEKTAFKLEPLNINSEKLFPVNYDIEAANSQTQYNKLWEKFIQDFEKILKFENHRYFADTIYFLLKKYCWNIPAATNENYPISSLFEHSKITAAIAWCFKVFKEEAEAGFQTYQKGEKLKLNKGQLPLLLLCVDLSGIQKFIYNISSKYAAKCLRGRSFYLQMMLQDIAREILHRTGAYYSNIVYSSGGKLFMLLPNTTKIKNIIKELENELLKNIWLKYNGEIFVCIGSVSFAYDNDIKDDTKPRLWIEGYNTPQHFSVLWKSAIEKAASKKNKRFSNLILTEEGFNKFFKPTGEGGKKQICAITGRELKEQSDLEIIDDENEEKITVSKEVYEQKIIGEELPGHNYIAFGLENSFLKEKVVPLITKHKLHIGNNTEDINIKDSELFFTLKNNEPDFLPKNINNNLYGFQYFGGTSYPIKDKNKVKTFEELAEDSPVNKIGFLRMDVDSLGNLFINGFKTEIEKNGKTYIKDYSSFSNYATLSGMLDLFFSGYINTIRENKDFKDYVAIIYSGGDDLFAVGRWDKIIDFAYEVQKEFKRYTGRNDITISAGIEITGPKFPIARAAEMAGEAEELAKNHEYNGQVKNSVCLFGVPINWDLEYEKVKEWKEKLVNWLKDETITRGLLMQLIGYYEKWLESKKDENKKEDLSWKWNAAYNLARRIKSVKDETKREALEELKKLVFTEINEGHMRFEAFAVAMRWAELETRKSKNNNNN